MLCAAAYIMRHPPARAEALLLWFPRPITSHLECRNGALQVVSLPHRTHKPSQRSLSFAQHCPGSMATVLMWATAGSLPGSTPSRARCRMLCCREGCSRRAIQSPSCTSPSSRAATPMASSTAPPASVPWSAVAGCVLRFRVQNPGFKTPKPYCCACRTWSCRHLVLVACSQFPACFVRSKCSKLFPAYLAASLIPSR